MQHLKQAFTVTLRDREQVFTFPLWNEVTEVRQKSCINTEGMQLFFQTKDPRNRKNPGAYCL